MQPERSRQRADNDSAPRPLLSRIPMWKCSWCGAQNVVGLTFCLNARCGARVPVTS